MLVALWGGLAHAQDDDPVELRQAKELFGEGLRFLDAGLYERALDRFKRSRDLVPGKGNTINAAVCLERLRRYDEALELYEIILARFGDTLDEADRAAIVPAMERLRGHVGNVRVSANVSGSLVIDGQPRGVLPRREPVRVLAGEHVVRVLKDGYGTFETTISVDVRELVSVDARLRPLEAAGQLRVDDPSLVGAEVFVDGATVGVVPWEGTLGPGDHLVWIRKGDRGTAPRKVVVVQGQGALIELESTRLGPTATLLAIPSTAALSIDGVDVGAGRWSGRLPVGPHVVRASEEGYFTQAADIEQPAPGEAPISRTLRLVVDEDHPRWPAGDIGTFWVGAFGGLAAGPTFAADAEQTCPNGCTVDPQVFGYMTGLRVGFRFPFQLSLGLAGGIVGLSSTFTRAQDRSFVSAGMTTPIRYVLDDDLQMRGPFVAGSISYRVALYRWLGLLARTSVGVVFASSSDAITATATDGLESVSAGVSDVNETLSSTPLFVMPEAALDARLGSVELGVGIALAVFPFEGPSFGHEQIEVRPDGCTLSQPDTVHCAPISDGIAGELAYDSFVLLVPQISAAYAF